MRVLEGLLPLFDWNLNRLLESLPAKDDPIWNVNRLRQTTYNRFHSDTRSILFAWLDNEWKVEEPVTVVRHEYASKELSDAVFACGLEISRYFQNGLIVKLMLTELRSGGKIALHADLTPSLTLVHRCHLPIVSNEDTIFEIGGLPYILKPGIVYEFDNTRMHSVVNDGATVRVHLICDIMPPGHSTLP